MKKIKFLLLLVFSLLFGETQAQTFELISSGGGVYVQNNISLSWSVGEGMTETYTNTPFILNQGFQQGNLSTTGIVNPEKRNTCFEVFPNPAENEITISEKTFSNEPFQWVICDIKGITVLQGTSNRTETKISTGKLSGGLYFLQIKYNSGIQTKKIIKTNK